LIFANGVFWARDVSHCGARHFKLQDGRELRFLMAKLAVLVTNLENSRAERANFARQDAKIETKVVEEQGAIW
jgi:hypothetical protein